MLFEIISEGASWMNKIWASFQCSKRRFKAVFRSSKHEIGGWADGGLYTTYDSCGGRLRLTEAEKVLHSPSGEEHS